MKYMAGSFLCNIASAIVHIIMVYFFVYHFDWGFDGICIATCFQFTTRFFVSLAYLTKIKELENVKDVRFLSRETIMNLGFQFKLGCFSFLMGVWGWWAFDIFTLIGSYLSVEIISGQTVMRSIGIFTFMVPIGFSIACAILVG